MHDQHWQRFCSLRACEHHCIAIMAAVWRLRLLASIGTLDSDFQGQRIATACKGRLKNTDKFCIGGCLIIEVVEEVRS